jgi:hypothetical protein
LLRRASIFFSIRKIADNIRIDPDPVKGRGRIKSHGGVQAGAVSGGGKAFGAVPVAEFGPLSPIPA